MKGPIQSWDLDEDQIEKIKIIKEAELFEQCVKEITGTMITEVTDTHFISDELPVDDYEFFDAITLSIHRIDEYFRQSEELLRKEV